MKQLDRLLFEQGGACFFCRKLLPKAEASIEHLVASANGGPNHEDNCVVCCKTLNALLGSKPLKYKFQVILNQKGGFPCPAESLRLEPSATAKLTASGNIAKPKASSPVTPTKGTAAKPMFTLAATKPSAQPPPPSSGHARTVTCPTCKASVPAAIGQLDYKCQSCGGAFRY